MRKFCRTIVVGEDGRGLYDLRGVSDCFFFILGDVKDQKEKMHLLCAIVI